MRAWLIRPRASLCAHTGAALFASHGLTRIDLLDLDAEGHEAAILRGIDWSAVTIDIILVEANDLAVNKLLADKGYTKMGHRLHRDDVFLRSGFRLLGESRGVGAPYECQESQ